VGNLLNQRRADTAKRCNELRQELADAEKLCSDVACVYATGSFARGEASRHSDLDLFIVGRRTPSSTGLSNLKAILIKADLIEATEKLGFPEFSGDGEYLAHHTLEELVKKLGTPHDDVTNTFTARLLLLLESSPLLGKSVYSDVTQEVIGAYWRDYQDHKKDFMPAFLSNDILRMWRTFCVNYEARTLTEPAEKKAKRKLKNYKLKHSRLLTCYSALLYLLAIFSRRNTVSPTDAVEMISLTPTQRLEWMLAQGDLSDSHPTIKQLIGVYENFLQQSDASEEEMVKRFMDKDKTKTYFESAYRFGDLMFEALSAVGQKNRFHRLLVV
jgi:predicted nucleotidyltransferase